MEKSPQTNTTHHLEASSFSPPTFPSRGLSRLPIARLSPPPSTSGHVPFAAPATHGCALNLCPPGWNVEAGAARAARSAGGWKRRREPGPAAAAGPTMTCYRGFLLGSCRRVAGGRAAALRGPGAGGPAARPRLGGDGGGRRHLGQGQPRELAGCGSRPDGGFRPSRVVVVAKTTRYEFEQQRYRYAELSEEDLKQLVGPGGPRPCASARRWFAHWLGRDFGGAVLGIAPQAAPGEREPLGAAMGSGKEAMVPQTHPLLVGRTARPGHSGEPVWLSLFRAGTWFSDKVPGVCIKSSRVSSAGQSSGENLNVCC